jgi:hypothetical protein
MPRLSALLSVVAAAALLTGCGTDAAPVMHPSTDTPGGRFAGYYEKAYAVTSVQATWTVPQLAITSRPGRAGTWVGALAPGPANAAPFIQIGTNEEREHSRYGNSDHYYVFWSDTAHHFHPVGLFGVVPGDRVRASLQHDGGHWILRAYDLDSRIHRQVRTAEETSARFNEGQWYQEDITETRSGRAYPYPTLTPTRFRGLRINGGRPADEGWMTSQRMTTPTVAVAPDAVSGAGFTVRAHPLHPHD